jgi:hypothetical protein
LAIKEMPLEERYNKLFDQYVQDSLMNFVLHKQLGTMDKRNDMLLKVWKKMLPSYMGIALKVMKTIAPGKTFKNIVTSFVSFSQATTPLSNIELTWVSDREALIRTKNCPMLLRGKELAQKAGLDIDPKEICKNDSKVMPKMFEEFGVEVNVELEENGCRAKAKLK